MPPDNLLTTLNKMRVSPHAPDQKNLWGDCYDEIVQLRSAIALVCEDVWGYSHQDDGDVQDYLESCGILVEVPASPEVRSEFDCDTMFALRWSQAAINAERAVAKGEG